MAAWLWMALAYFLALLAKPVFWICVCLLWAGTIVSNAIESSTKAIGRRLDLIIQKLRRDASEEDDDEEYLDEL